MSSAKLWQFCFGLSLLNQNVNRENGRTLRPVATIRYRVAAWGVVEGPCQLFIDIAFHKNLFRVENKMDWSDICEKPVVPKLIIAPWHSDIICPSRLVLIIASWLYYLNVNGEILLSFHDKNIYNNMSLREMNPACPKHAQSNWVLDSISFLIIITNWLIQDQIIQPQLFNYGALYRKVYMKYTKMHEKQFIYISQI